MKRGSVRLRATSLVLGASAVFIFSAMAPTLAAATPGSPDDPSVPTGIGLGRVIVLRPVRVDLIDDGAVQRSVALAGGAISLQALAVAVNNPNWITYSAGGVVLTAGLLQRPGTALQVNHTKVDLVNSATDPSFLAGSGATLRISDTTVTSSHLLFETTPSSVATRATISYKKNSHVFLDASMLERLGHAGAGGAAVSVSDDSTLVVRRSTIASSSAGLEGDSGSRLDVAGVTEIGNNGVGLAVGQNSTLIARGNVIRGGRTGVVASRAAAVTLDNVTDLASTADGVDLRGAGSSQLTDVRVTGSGGFGVRIVGSPLIRASNVTTTGNHLDGLRITGSRSAILDGVTTTGNDVGGLSVVSTRTAILSRVQATGNTGTGISLAGGEDDSLNQVQSNGNSQTGIRLTGLPTSARLVNVSTSHNAGAGFLVSDSPGVKLPGLRSTDDMTSGVTVIDSAHAKLDGLMVSRTQDGIVVRGGPGTSVLDPTVTDSKRAVWIEAGSEGSRISGGLIQRAAVGISVTAMGVRVDDAVIKSATVGVVVGAVHSTTLERDRILGSATGVRVIRGSSQTAIDQTTVMQQGGTGISVTGAGLMATNDVIDGATTGFLLHGSSTVADSSVSSALEAVRAGSGTAVLLSNDRLSASAVGVRALSGADVRMRGTRVSALFGTRGRVRLLGHANRLPPLPLHWLGLFGVIAVGAAVVLELIRRFRELGNPPLGSAPLYIRNSR